jgi:hypothetical protein
MQQNR